MAVLNELENIDDDTDRHGISFVKTQDLEMATSFGVSHFPALIYFENQVPSVYEGDIISEDVLQWLILQKAEDRIETVTRGMLESIVTNVQYLAVYFYKPQCKACDHVLQELENIDDECDLYGIQMVKIQDPQLAKRYGIKTFPALVYFRNGNPLLYDGDLKNEDSVLEWLTDDENRELADEIEAVNSRMLERLLDESPFLAVFFYENDCHECNVILAELENIDDEADKYGIDFVKINDHEAALKYGITHPPGLIYFRKRTALIFDGDLLDEDRVLSWLTSQDVFEIKDEIEEVNRKMLDKLLEENEFVAVYFYDNNCPKCHEVMMELEKIDDETDNLDITFVKIRDPRYARKYGVNKFPALVYFRRRFPSIYRGDLLAEEEVLEWLQKNRFKQPELNLFMYALGAITSAFISYTVFLMFCFKGHAKTA